MDRKEKQQKKVLEIERVVLCRNQSAVVWEAVSEKIEGNGLRAPLGTRTHRWFSLLTKAV